MRDHYRATASRYRGLPGKYGLRHRAISLFCATTSVSGLKGNASYTEIPILESGYPPKIRELDEEQLALGNYAEGTVKVGPITPEHATGGTALVDLIPMPDAENWEMFFYVITEENGEQSRYALKGWGRDRALHYTLTLARTGAHRE